MLSQSYKKDKKEWWSVYGSPHLRARYKECSKVMQTIKEVVQVFTGDIKLISFSVLISTVQKPHPGGHKNVKTLFDLQAKTSLF